MREEVLKDLESTLPTYSITEEFTNYSRSIRDLHRVCTSKKLNLKEAKKVIDSFSDQFYNLYMEYDLGMTLKTHIMIDLRRIKLHLSAKNSLLSTLM